MANPMGSFRAEGLGVCTPWMLCSRRAMSLSRRLGLGSFVSRSLSRWMRMLRRSSEEEC